MDPSYTNSVQNGGVSGGEALGGRPGVSDGMNAGFGAGGAPAGSIISSGDGLGMNTTNVAAAAPAPRRRWPWVVIGALVVVAVVVGIVAVAMSQNGGNNLRQAFNKYANYALFGTNSTEDLNGGYSQSVNYFFGYADDEKNIEEVYQRMENLNADFVGKYYNGNNQKRSAELDELVNWQSNTLRFSLFTYVNGMLGLDGISQYYNENGSDAAKTYVNTYFDELNYIGNEPDYIIRLKEWGEAYIQYRDLQVAQNECLLEAGEELDQCNSIFDEVAQAREAVADLNLRTLAIAPSSYDFSENFYTIRDLLFGASENSAENAPASDGGEDGSESEVKE